MALSAALLGFRPAGVGGQHLLFTVPAGERWLLRDLRLYNGTGGAALVKAMHWDPALGGAFIVSQDLVANRIAELVDAFVVFDAGMQLYVLSSQGDFSASASGHKWVLP